MPPSPAWRDQKIFWRLCGVVVVASVALPSFSGLVHHWDWAGEVNLAVSCFPAVGTKRDAIPGVVVQPTPISKLIRWRIWRWFRLRQLELLMLRLHLVGKIRTLFFLANVSLYLFPKWVKLVAKYGRHWRLRVLDYEVVQFLQCERDVHKALNHKATNVKH